MFEIVAKSGTDGIADVYVAREKGGRGRIFEFVDGLDHRYKRQDKWIINISTQFGCPLNCLFCDASHTFEGNIALELMMGQISAVLKMHDESLKKTCRKLKVHFARMGEPALNPSVPEAIGSLRNMTDNPDLWACVATTLPKGSGSWLRRLREAKEMHFRGRFQLQFSINSTDDSHRSKLMPFDYEDLGKAAEFGAYFFTKGDRKVALNFALAKGVAVEPDKIRRLFDPEIFAIKLTPLNPTSKGRESGLSSAFQPVDSTCVISLVEEFRDAGFETVLSIGDQRENEIGSNCGQAARSVLDNAAL